MSSSTSSSSSNTSSSASRRRKCLPKLYHSAKAGCLTMDEEMFQDLGIVIHSSGGEVCNATFSPALSPSSEDDISIFWDSDIIASHFRDYMYQFAGIYGRKKFLEWPDSDYDNAYWGLQTIMTNVDQAEAVAITIHSRAATDTEILMTEFIACYLTADIAWCHDRNHQRALTGTQDSQRRKVTEDNEIGFKSPMRGLPIRLVSIHGQDIRILSMYFTQEYYQSFQKATQSTSGNLDIRIESFRLPDDWEPQTEIKKLAKPSTWLQKQMKTSDNGMIGDLDGGVCSSKLTDVMSYPNRVKPGHKMVLRLALENCGGR